MNTRLDYREKNGLATWWQKDGAWHVALPNPKKPGNTLFWTDKSFSTREQAIQYIKSKPEYT